MTKLQQKVTKTKQLKTKCTSPDTLYLLNEKEKYLLEALNDEMKGYNENIQHWEKIIKLNEEFEDLDKLTLEVTT